MRSSSRSRHVRANRCSRWSARCFSAPAYGFCLVAGLLETQRIADPSELAGLTAVYYSLTYVGFAVPIVLAELAHGVSYAVLLLAMAALALITLGTVVINGRRSAETRP